MSLTALGSMGMGLMWGWLLVLLGGRGTVKRSIVNILALGLATVIFASQLFLFTNLQALILFLAGMLLTFILHLAWTQSLRSSRPE